MKSNSIQDEIIEKAGQEMAREIDREILWGFLEELGWIRVMINRNFNLEINEWLVHHCKNAYERHNRDFIFEDSKDANWFKLRWLS